MKYRPEIDGLRAVAVLPVILFHAGFEAFSGGYVGVDVFFVISGYLITSIILNDLEQGRFSIARFYERRAKRILPALFLVVAVTVPLAWLALDEAESTDFAQSLIAVAIFSSNIHFWMEADYFATAAELKPLLHTWSLAVEEQYYVLYPLLLMGLWRLGRRRIVAVLSVLFVASLVAAEIMVDTHPSAAFFLLPTRAWELTVGAFCAFRLHNAEVPTASRAGQVLSLAGVAAIAVAIFTFDENTPTPGLWMLLPTLGTACIVLYANAGTVAQRILSLSPVVQIGLISYSAYLWHQPFFAITRQFMLEAPPTWIMLALSALSLALAWLSWRLVETPFRRSKVDIKTVFRRSLAASAAVLLLGLFGHWSDGYPKTGWANVLEKSFKSALPDVSNRALGRRTWDMLKERAGDKSYFIEDNDFDNTLWFNLDDERVKLLLVGNSHSKDMYNLLTFSEDAKQSFDVARYGAHLRFLTEDHPFYTSPNYQHADWIMIVSRIRPWDEHQQAIGSVVKRMLDDGKNVAICKSVYEFPMFRDGEWVYFEKIAFDELVKNRRSQEEVLTMSDAAHYTVYKYEPPNELVRTTNATIDAVAAANPSLLVLDRMDYMCDDEESECYAADAAMNKYLYGNGHTTLAGAQFYATRVDEIDWLSPLLEE